jgi:hypothetical protein
MRTDKITKQHLAAIAVGLFVNALATFTAPAYGIGSGQGVVIVGASSTQEFSPITVQCLNC